MSFLAKCIYFFRIFVAFFSAINFISHSVKFVPVCLSHYHQYHQYHHHHYQLILSLSFRFYTTFFFTFSPITTDFGELNKLLKIDHRISSSNCTVRLTN